MRILRALVLASFAALVSSGATTAPLMDTERSGTSVVSVQTTPIQPNDTVATPLPLP